MSDLQPQGKVIPRIYETPSGPMVLLHMSLGQFAAFEKIMRDNNVKVVSHWGIMRDHEEYISDYNTAMGFGVSTVREARNLLLTTKGNAK